MNMFKKKDGFTLVELIVVIAILAILAGVAVPAYTGYINKANEAADTQVLSAANTAFAAACTENQVAPTAVTATLNVDGTSKTITGITVTASGSVTAAMKTEIEADFTNYFAGNSTALKYYGSFNQSNGNFVGVKG